VSGAAADRMPGVARRPSRAGNPKILWIDLLAPDFLSFSGEQMFIRPYNFI
jgi:hypothetical protein